MTSKKKVHTLINDYSNYLISNENKSYKTVKSYASDINVFFDYIKEKNNIRCVTLDILNNIDFSYLSEYITALHTNKDSVTTRSRKVSSLRRFFNYLVDFKLIENNPTLKLKKPKLEKKLPIFLSKEEENNLINSIDNIRDKAIIITLLNTGLRLNELINIKISNIKDDLIFVESRKGSKQQYMPLNQKCKKVIEEWLKIRPDCDNEYIFISNRKKKISARTVQKNFNKYRDKSGINKNVTVHKLRHTFATRLVQKNVPLPNIQALMGHNDIKTTTIYMHYDNKDLKNAVSVLDN